MRALEPDQAPEAVQVVALVDDHVYLSPSANIADLRQLERLIEDSLRMSLIRIS